MLIGSILVGNISEFNFTLKAIQKLFQAKTNDDLLFPQPKKIDGKGAKKKEKFAGLANSGDIKPKLSKKLSKIRVIKFSVWQQVKLYFMALFSCFENCCKYKDNKLWILFTEGQERIEKEFDLVKIITSLRNLKILSKKNLDAKTKA